MPSATRRCRCQCPAGSRGQIARALPEGRPHTDFFNRRTVSQTKPQRRGLVNIKVPEQGVDQAWAFQCWDLKRDIDAFRITILEAGHGAYQRGPMMPAHCWCSACDSLPADVAQHFAMRAVEGVTLSIIPSRMRLGRHSSRQLQLPWLTHAWFEASRSEQQKRSCFKTERNYTAEIALRRLWQTLHETQTVYTVDM